MKISPLLALAWLLIFSSYVVAQDSKWVLLESTPLGKAYVDANNNSRMPNGHVLYIERFVEKAGNTTTLTEVNCATKQYLTRSEKFVDNYGNSELDWVLNSAKDWRDIVPTSLKDTTASYACRTVAEYVQQSDAPVRKKRVVKKNSRRKS
jgi:hypothetical protein